MPQAGDALGHQAPQDSGSSSSEKGEAQGLVEGLEALQLAAERAVVVAALDSRLPVEEAEGLVPAVLAGRHPEYQAAERLQQLQIQRVVPVPLGLLDEGLGGEEDAAPRGALAVAAVEHVVRPQGDLIPALVQRGESCTGSTLMR